MTTPGWYADPDGTASRERYCDGSTWTQQVRHANARTSWPASTRVSRTKREVLTWVIVAVNDLFLVCSIAVGALGSGKGTYCGRLDQRTCNSLHHAGTAGQVVVVLVVWAVFDVLLGMLWLVSRQGGIKA